MRVLVTRGEPEAGRTATLLASLGHRPLVAPLLTAQALPATVDVSGVVAVAVTSARTAAFLPDDLRRAMRDLPVFAVGDRTAAALRDAGIPDVRAADGDVAALAGLIRRAGLPPGGRILHPGGADRAGDLAGALEAQGLSVLAVTVYRMVAALRLPETAREALASGEVDAVLHYSPRSARIFTDLVLATGLAEAARRPLHACLSPAVAVALEPLAAPRVISSIRPDEAALLGLLAT